MNSGKFHATTSLNLYELVAASACMSKMGTETTTSLAGARQSEESLHIHNQKK
jgi:hypothetical protein